MTVATTADAIRHAAPAVYGDGHAMSTRYHQVNTGALVDRLMARGFVPTIAVQDNPRRRNPLHVTHKVHMTLPALAETREARPELIIVNSHNGRTKLRVYAGIYRMICSNGMVAGRAFMDPVAARHYADPVAEALEMAMVVADQLERIGLSVEAWGNLALSAAQQESFAREAAQLRWGDRAEAYPTAELLEAHRPDDVGDDLWRVFNRVQENTTTRTIHGTSADGRKIQARGLTAVLPNLEYNSELWNRAAALAPA